MSLQCTPMATIENGRLQEAGWPLKVYLHASLPSENLLFPILGVSQELQATQPLYV